MREKLLCALEEHKGEYLQLVKNLVACDTRDIGHGIDGGTEINGQILLEKVFSSMDAKIEKDQVTEETIQRALKEYHEGNPGHNLKDRYNLVATFSGAEKGRSLLFNGHMDTMPVGDAEKWDTDPFTATEKDGKLYGLGTTDMKGGIAAAVCAVKLLKEVGYEIPGTVKIASVVDEEGGGNGSISLTMNGYNADAAVVCEPSDCQVVTANMGFIFFEVAVLGVSLHSSYKWLGVNAIDKAVLLMEALAELERKWLMTYKHPLLPSPTINVGVIEGGDAGSSVPDKCVFKLCLHYIPSCMEYDAVVKDVTDAINTRASGDAWLRENPPKIKIYQAGGGYEIDREHPFVKTVCQAIDKTYGNPEMVVSGSGNDARLYQHIAKVPVVVFGPGSRGKGHRPNEFLEIENFYKCILAYAQLIIDWCN